MKKLIISIVATASIALVAKADVLNGTSFENYQGENGFQVDLDDSGLPNAYLYWSGGDDAQFEFIDVVEEAKAVRPKYWADQTNVKDAKALAIDTDEALARHVATKDKGPQEISTGLYFDSMVQFTATTDVPTVTPGDKLIVWLKEYEPQNDGEESTFALHVTAGVKYEGEVIATPFRVTNVEVAPDSWHRLTIAIDKTGDTPTFKVYVDGTLVTYIDEADENAVAKSCEKNPFGSLAPAGMIGADKITSVSFQGKGAIDDLVWTRDVNEVFAPATTTVTVTYNGPEIGEDGPFISYTIGESVPSDIKFTEGSCSLTIGLGKTVEFSCLIASGWKVDGFEKGQVDEDGYVTWTRTFENVTADFTSLAIKITTPVAQIGETTYLTLGDAIRAAAAGDEIKLLDTIATDAAFVITKEVTINLNGYTVKTTENDKSGDGVFWVQQGGVLTIGGNGTVNGLGGNRWNIAVFADGGTVIINGGTYTNVDAQGPDMTHFDLIYAKNRGKVEINGGTFICATPKWTLNSHDTATGTFLVKGGSFKGYDPSNMETEVGFTSWCADGYEAKQDTEGYYVVTKKTTTVQPGAPVEVDSEAAANAVEIEVEVPAGVQITPEAYRAYFEKSIKQNPETLKYEVSAVLKDEVAPVIEATTDDDGVTPAISFDANGNVTINISNKLPGLFYGVKYATTVGGVEAAEPIPGLTVETNGGTAGFFRVVVDFKEIPDPADAE